MTESTDPSQEKRTSGTENFTHRVLVTVGIVIPVVLLLLLFGVAFKVLLLILAGILFAAFFRGISGLLHQYLRIPKGWSLLAAVIGVIGLIFLAGWLIAPQVSEQVDELSKKLPEAVRSTKAKLAQTPWVKDLIDQIPENPLKALEEQSGLLKKTFGVFSSTFGVLADIYVILFIGLFMMVQPGPYQKGIISLVPLKHRDRAQEVLNKVGTTLQRWIAGKLLSMLVVAVLTAIGLYALGIPLALALALIAGLLSFIPNFGPIIALIPAILIGLMEGPNTALYVALLYIGVQAVESNVITPLVEKQMVFLPPAIILISQVLLGVLVGGLGLILATPIVAIVMVLTNMLYVQDVLGDRSSDKDSG